VLEVELEVAGGRVMLLATHLDHRRPDAERLASAKTINELIGKQTLPALLAGDLNAVPESAVLAEVLKQWTNTTREPKSTIPVDKPERQIDYVLVRPAQRWRVVEARVLDEAVASDHRAVVAEVELRIE
jgi:endonuclease/exonuclease/phosphatase family metal-dependent hydrolase